MAIFETDTDTHVEHVWFVSLGGRGDVMGMLYRQPGEPWIARMRTRFYHGPDPDDPDDRKQVFEVRRLPDETDDAFRDRARSKLQEMVDLLAAMGGEVWSLAVGGRQTLAEALEGMPWAHTRLSAPGPVKPQ